MPISNRIAGALVVVATLLFIEPRLTLAQDAGAQEVLRLFSMSLLQNGLAAWAVSQPGGTLPSGVSKANVDFLKKHDAELKQLEPLRQKDRCDDEVAEDDADE